MSWSDFLKTRFALPLDGAHQDQEAIRNFTPRAQQVLALARKEADSLNHNFVGTEHVLLGLIRLGQGVAVTVLQKLGLDLETVKREVEKQVGKGPDQKLFGNIPYTPRVKKVLALAANEAKALNHSYVGTEHILLGLLQEGDGVAARVLKDLDVDVEQTRQEVLKELDPNFQPESTPAPQRQPLPTARHDLVDTTKRYDVYCTERQQEIVVYRNVLLKGVRRLFPADLHPVLYPFVELEQEDGRTIFVARSSIVKFCEHLAPAGSETASDKEPSTTDH